MGGIPGKADIGRQEWIGKPLTDKLNKIHHGGRTTTRLGKGNNSAHIQTKMRHTRLRKLSPDMHDANSIQNMANRSREKLIQILHLAKSTPRYGYKQGISTIDAIREIEEYIQEGANESQILLMGLSKALDTKNRTQRRPALYKKEYL